MGKEKRVLASYTHWDREESLPYREKLQAILNSSVWAKVLNDRKSSSYELRVGSSTVFCLEIDEEWRVFCVVVTAAYPSRHVFSGTSDSYSIMREFRSHVLQYYALPSLSSGPDGLQGSLTPFFRQLCAKYDDLDALDRPVVSPSLPSRRDSSSSQLLGGGTPSGAPHSESTRLLMVGSGIRKPPRRLQAAQPAAGKLPRVPWMYVIILLGGLVISAVTLVVLNYALFHWWGDAAR